MYVGSRTLEGGGVISQFRVGSDGVLHPLSPPTVRTGQDPHLLVADPRGHFLYAVVEDAHTALYQYRIRPDGTLAPLAPPTVPFGGTRRRLVDDFTALTFAPDGRYAYALIGNPYTVEGMNHGRAIVYRASGGGALTQVPGEDLTDLQGPWSLAFLPSGRYAYLLTGGTSDLGNSGNLHIYQVGPDGGLVPGPAQLSQTNPYSNPDTVLADPSGRYVYVSTDSFLQQYAVGAGGVLIPTFQMSGATSYPVSDGDGSLLFMLSRLPEHENTPGFSAVLETVRVDIAGHLTPRRYWMHADGSLQVDPIPRDQWERCGYALVLRPTPDGRMLYALRPGANYVKPFNYSCVYSYAVDPATGALQAAHPLVKVPDAVSMVLIPEGP